MVTTKNDGDGHIYQPVVFYNKEIKVGFHHEMISYPFYAPIVFEEPSDATAYLSMFIKEMVEDGDLPKDAILDGGKINETVIRAAVQELVLCKLEKEDTVE